MLYFTGALLFALAAAQVGLFLILPLSLIWFSEALGSYTGFVKFHYVDKPSPGWTMHLAGWIVLLGPMIAAGIRACVA